MQTNVSINTMSKLKLKCILECMAGVRQKSVQTCNPQIWVFDIFTCGRIFRKKMYSLHPHFPFSLCNCSSCSPSLLPLNHLLFSDMLRNANDHRTSCTLYMLPEKKAKNVHQIYTLCRIMFFIKLVDSIVCSFMGISV